MECFHHKLTLCNSLQAHSITYCEGGDLPKALGIEWYVIPYFYTARKVR